MDTRTDKPFLPYGRQHVTDEDIRAVVEVLKSDYLTQGPAVEAFEEALARTVGADNVVACSNGTAALHLAMLAMGVGEGDVVVTTPITFMASANCARYTAAAVQFVDVDPNTALIDPDRLERALQRDRQKKIKAVIPVHFAGQPADLIRVHEMAREHGAYVVDDACHALGASFTHRDQVYKLGGNRYSDMTAFSFHSVKHVAMGEGGAVATANPDLAERLGRFRNHGIQQAYPVNSHMAYASDGTPNPWYHELQELGFNYRVSDLAAALGRSQLMRLEGSLKRRREIAALYGELIRERFEGGEVSPLAVRPNVSHAYHLYVVQVKFDYFGVDRATVMRRLREANIGSQVHYIPVHLQPYYQKHSGTGPGDCPMAEQYYARALTIPMYPELADTDCERVIDELARALRRVGWK
ncbi:MAG: UDP-4-amino-4,6-dideoxy-N-acetyl-beta-L-altrosamine transaminase [candidate division Zixibacteria bacterium]|nr:UDP-4-amino-4,6-dideoxy-N-acetyl-beta-L-altrosamine transaminase [candidate division Zixibacteria bacterium]